MTTNYPTSLDAASTVGGGTKPESTTPLDESGEGHPVHSAMHQNVGDALLAIETKLGTGDSSPASNKVLVASGAGSAWGEVAQAMIAADAVNGTKIADNAIDSEHYVNGSIDEEHLADDAVSADKQGFISAGTTSTKPASPSAGDIYLQHEA